MGIGPAPSISKLLSLTGKTLSNIDLVEVILINILKRILYVKF